MIFKVFKAVQNVMKQTSRSYETYRFPGAGREKCMWSHLEQKEKKLKTAAFMGIVQWVNHHPDQRKRLFGSLFSTYRYISDITDFFDRKRC